MRVVATAGHVDHGKSSLVRLLTGTDPDRWEEERRRGMTIDLGFAHTVLPDGEAISIIDVPGHVRFLRNMLAGVGAVDACIFVVAATEGWKPQSEEHLRILSLLGVQHGVVAMTMRDLVDDDTVVLREHEVADHLAGSFLDGAPIVAVSNTTRAGLDDLRAELARLGLPHRQVDGRALPFADGAFDAALCIEVLEHIDEPRAFLREVSRVAPRLIVSVPNCELLGYLWDHLATPWHMLEASHVNFFTRWSLGALLREFYPEVELGFHTPYPLRTLEGTPLHYNLLAVARRPA